MLSSLASLLAYIDPGSGALVVQAVVASVVGGAFAFRDAIGSWFRRWFVRPKADAEPAATLTEIA